jgi:hypothetical protein
LVVRGALQAARSDIYFTKTDHQHTAFGNTTGFAAIENATNPYNALMILGRQTATGRMVKLWDYLQVNGKLDVTGALTIGTTTSPFFLINQPNPPGAGTIRLGDWLLRTNGNVLELVHAPPQVQLLGQPQSPERVIARFNASASGSNRLTYP